MKLAVMAIPKTIDNDIPVIDKSFGFDTAVEQAVRGRSWLCGWAGLLLVRLLVVNC